MSPTKREIAVAVMDETFHAARTAIEIFLRGSPLQNAATSGFPIPTIGRPKASESRVDTPDMPAPRSLGPSRRTLGVLLGAVLVLAAPAAASLSPDRLLSSALANARAQRSVHYVSTGSSGTVGVRMVCDAARDRGIQRITFHKAGKTGQATVLAVANTAYLRADQFALINYLGFSASAAKRDAGHWLKIPSSSPAYRTVSAAVRLSSMLAELALPKPLTRLPQSTVEGQHVIGLRNSSVSSGHRVTRTLYVRAAGLRLPVAESTQGGGSQSGVVLSRWNEPVRVSAPRGATLLK